MKKTLRFCLALLLLCLLFTISAAAESWTDSKTGEYYHVINNSSDLKNVIESCAKSDKKIHLLLRFPDYDIYDTIEINTSNHFVFEPDGYNSVSISSEDDSEPLFYISDDAPGTVLEFKIPDKDLAKYTGVLIYSYNEEDEGGAIYIDGYGSKIIGGKFHGCNATDDDGGAIYVNADNVTIDGSCFEGCCADGDGGAICVDGDDCTIRNCKFAVCRSDGYYGGGAIYFCSGADRGYVGGCEFDGCDADDGECVYGDKDTKIWNCTPGFGDEDEYYHCKAGSYRGSIFSLGNIWIIIIILAVVIVAAVLLILKKKKASGRDAQGDRENRDAQAQALSQENQEQQEAE